MKYFIAILLLIVFFFSLDAETNILKLKADSLYASGKANQRAMESDEALINLNQALELYEQLDVKKETGNTLNRIGLVYGQILGNWSKAEGYWIQALEVREALEDKKGIANICNSLAIAYDKMAEYSKSEECYRKTLDYRVEIHDSLNICGILKNLGLLKLQQEMFYDSEVYFTRSLKIAEENNYNNLVGEIKNNFGLLEFSKGIYSEAHNNFTQALTILEDSANFYEKAEIINNLGTIYSAYNDTISARIFYYKALDLCERTGNLDLKARIFNNLGSYYLDLKMYKKALEFLQNSLAIKKEINNRKGIVTTLINIGDLYIETDELEKANQFYQEAKEKIDEFGFIYQEAKVLFALGNIEIRKKKYSEALTYISRGMNIAENLDNPVLLYKSYFLMGNCYEMQNQNDEAADYYLRSIEKIENIRKGIGLEEHRSSFMANALGVYRSMIELQIKNNDPEAAFEYYERMKTRNLLDILDGAFLIFEEEMTEEEIEHQRILEANLRNVTKNVSNYSTEENSTRSLDSLVTHQRTIRRELDQLKTSLIFNHPDLKKKMGEGEPIDIKDSYKLINSNEAVLAYVVFDKKIVCFVLRNIDRRNRYTKVVEIDISKNELAESINNLKTKWKPSSFKTLYDVLITSLSEELQGVTQICIIPDGHLNALPFHALKNRKNGKYLIEEFTVYYTNSLSLLSELRSFGTSGKESIIAFGNPQFGEEGITTFRGTLASLPATEEEVKVISEIYGDRSNVFTGDQANEQNFIDFSSDYGIIHLASHGLMDELNPMYSSVLLTADEDNDGFLTAREILKLELNADMVVLSACDTAVGSLSEGEGLLGLSRAFFGALVPSVIASLWPVEDYSTKLLMEEFYIQLKEGKRPAKALRNAQLSLMENPNYSNPYFWAPFIFLGDTE